MMNDRGRETLEWELLWLQCRRGDPKAFEGLIAKLERPLYYFVRRIVANDADSWDVMQQVWIKVFRSMTKVAGSVRC